MSADPLDAFADAIADRIALRVVERLGAQLPAKPATSTPAAEFLNERAVQQRYDLPVRTLQTWRTRGGGPEWVRAGRKILYAVASVEKFLHGDSKRSRNGHPQHENAPNRVSGRGRESIELGTPGRLQATGCGLVTKGNRQ